MIHEISLVIHPVGIVLGSQLRQKILPVQLLLFQIISLDLAFDVLAFCVSASKITL